MGGSLGSIRDQAKAFDLSVGADKISASNGVACGGTNIGYSDSFNIFEGDYALEVQFTSDGDVDVNVIVEQGNVDLASADEGSANANYVVPNGKSVINVTDENVNILPISLAVSRKGRVKVTGSGSNHASTELTRCKLVRI